MINIEIDWTDEEYSAIQNCFNDYSEDKILDTFIMLYESNEYEYGEINKVDALLDALNLLKGKKKTISFLRFAYIQYVTNADNKILGFLLQISGHKQLHLFTSLAVVREGLSDTNNIPFINNALRIITLWNTALFAELLTDIRFHDNPILENYRTKIISKFF